MDLKVNASLEALNVHDNQMNVLITGGKDDDRAVVQDVIFNALEGAGFRNLSYEPNGYSTEPPMEVKSVLDAIKEQNPDFFNMPISIEGARRVYDTDGGLVMEPRDFPPPNAEAWDRITTYASKDSSIKMELSNGGLMIRF